MFPRPLIRMTICRNRAAHVFGTVSMTTERKLPPKTLNLNRRHMACEGPPGKKQKSINPLYTQTPLRWSFHNAQRAFSWWDSEKFSAVHATHFLRLSSGFPDNLEKIPDVCFDNLVMKREKNTPHHAMSRFTPAKHCGISAAANVRTFCSMSSAVW